MPRVNLRRALPVAVAICVVCALLGAAATAHVLARGQLLPYTSSTVERVRVFGGPELWIDRESPSPLDALNGLILATGAGMASLAAALTRRRRGPRRVFGFLALLAVGMGFLALDEQLGVHETIGFNLDFLADIPGVGSPEDVIFALYAVPVTAFFVRYRDLLSASPRGCSSRSWASCCSRRQPRLELADGAARGAMDRAVRVARAGGRSLPGGRAPSGAC